MVLLLPLNIAFLGLCSSSTEYISYGGSYAQYSGASAVWAFAFLIFIFYCIGYPIGLFLFLKKRDVEWFASQDNTNKFGFLWNDFKATMWCSRFLLLQLVRKFFHVFWTGFLRTAPGAQIAMVCVSNISYVLLLGLLRPYKSKLQGFVEFIAYFLITLNYLLTFGLLPQVPDVAKEKAAVAIAVFSIAACVSQFSTIVYRVILIFTAKAKAVPQIVGKANKLIRKSIHTLRGKNTAAAVNAEIAEDDAQAPVGNTEPVQTMDIELTEQQPETTPM